LPVCQPQNGEDPLAERSKAKQEKLNAAINEPAG